MDSSDLFEDIPIVSSDFFKVFSKGLEALFDIVFFGISLHEEQDSKNIWQGSVNGLQDLLEDLPLIFF